MKAKCFSALLIIAVFLEISAAAQSNASKERAEKIVRFSLAIKACEKAAFEVDPGTFATKIDRKRVSPRYRISGQSKTRLDVGWETDYVEIVGQKPRMLGLFKKHPDKDIAVFKVYTPSQSTVSAYLLVNNKIDLARIIMHEDYHAMLHGRAETTARIPQPIEESFAEAFSYFLLKPVLAEHLREANPEDVDRFIESETKRKQAINSCWNKLNNVYNSRFSRKEKLIRRKAVIKQCSEEIGEPVNNAWLSVWEAYSGYFFYAAEQLKRYGAKRFLDASREVPTSITDENAWLAEFEKCLAERCSRQPAIPAPFVF